MSDSPVPNKAMSASFRVNLFTAALVVAVLLSFWIVGSLPFAASQFGDIYFHEEAKALALFLHGAGPWSAIKISHAAGPVLFYTLPYLLVPAGSGGQAYWVAAYLCNLISILFATILVYRAACLLAKESAGRIAAILTLVSPFGVYYSFGVAAETPAYLGAAIFVYGWARHRTSEATCPWLACAGLIILILNRPNAAPLAGVALLIAAVGWIRKSLVPRRDAMFAFWCGLTSCLAISATYLLLAQQPGNAGLRTQATNASDIQLQGSFQFRTEPWDWRNWGRVTRQGSRDYENWSNEREAILRRSTETGASFGKLERAWVMQDIVTHPFLRLRMTAVRILSMNIAIVNSTTPASFGFGPIQGWWVFLCFHILLNAIGIAPVLGSVWFLFQFWGRLLTYWPLWAPWISLLVFHALVYAEPRYLLPSRPELCIMAALALTRYRQLQTAAVTGPLKEDRFAVAMGREAC